jgi:hypothetical protein
MDTDSGLRELIDFTVLATLAFQTDEALLHQIRDRETTERVVPYLHPLLRTAVV